MSLPGEGAHACGRRIDVLSCGVYRKNGVDFPRPLEGRLAAAGREGGRSDEDEGFEGLDTEDLGGLLEREPEGRALLKKGGARHLEVG